MSEPVITGPSDPQEPNAERAEQPEVGDSTTPRPKRRRGSRRGRNRNRTGTATTTTDERQPDELPERPNEGRPKTVEAAERALVRKPDPNAPRPKIGDSRPAPEAKADPATGEASPARRRRRRGGRGRSAGGGGGGGQGGGERRPSTPVQAMLRDDSPLELDDDVRETRRGRERKGRPLGRYLMCVHVQHPESGSSDGRVTQIAVLEGRSLLEHYVSRPAAAGRPL